MAALLPEIVGPGDSEKICATCGVMKPKTAFYFQKDASTDDGWCPKCKECRNKFKQEQRNKEIASHLQKIEMGMLKTIADGGGRQPMCDVVSGGEIVLQAFGGIEGLAQKLAADYEGMPIGTAGRTKILLGALQFVAKAMEQQKPMHLEEMSEDELKSALRKALGNEYRGITDESEDSASVGESKQS